MGEWGDLVANEPSLAVPPVVRETSLRVNFANYPGFMDWLLDQYALGFTPSRIKQRLDLIRDEQAEDGVQQWPSFSKREVDWYRSHLSTQWEPLRTAISRSIENQGVLAKNERLLALLRTANELESMMYDERNAKSGQLYLFSEYRAVLDQIAKEKGELGDVEASTDSKLVELAMGLASMLKVQGSGVQIVDADNFNYYEEEGQFEETGLLSESTDLQGDGVPTE